MKEAERRQTPGNTAASCDAARALLERARLTAFHHGSHLRELFHPKGSASGQASWDAVCTGVTRLRLSQSREHLPSRSSCRETDTQAAREQAANPPAGTALAPMTRCASAPRPSRSEDCGVTDTETYVNKKVTTGRRP